MWNSWSFFLPPIQSLLSMVVEYINGKKGDLPVFYVFILGLKTNGRIIRYCDRIRKMVKLLLSE